MGEKLTGEILIVEDSPTQAIRLQYLLEQRGYRTATEQNGKEALRYLKSRQPSLVISDVLMPEMNGYDLCRAVTGDELLRDIPVILLTSLNEPESVISALKSGAAGFVSKPLNEEFLISRIEQTLKGNSQQPDCLHVPPGQEPDDGDSRTLDFLLHTYEDAVFRNRQLTEANQKIQLLTEEWQKLAAVVENSTDMVAITNRDGLLQYLNESGRRILGTTASSEESLNLFDFCRGENCWRIRDKIIPAALEHGSWKGELILQSAAGMDIHVLLSSFCIRPREGDGNRFIGFIVHDMSEHYRSLDCLERSEIRLSVAQRIAHVGSWEWNEKEQEGYWSDETYRIFGCRRGSLKLGRDTVLDLVHPTDKVYVEAEFRKALSTRRPVSFDFRVLLSEGRVRYIHQEIEVQTDGAGEVVSIAGTVHDITALKLHELELIKSRDRAEAASRAKSEFLAGMSHELRTPLNAIIGFSDILQEGYFGELNEKQSQYMKDILESGRHLLSLINDILDLSKIEAGKVELEIRDIPVESLLDSSLVMIKERSLKHNIRLELGLPEDGDFHMKGDERMLKQVLYNLLSNAVKFTPEGGTIRLDAAPAGPDVRFCITDTGIGIEPENQERIFDEFFQIKSGITDKTPGTGLGLCLVKNMVEMHGGKVWIESEGTGQGSRFFFTIPLEPAAGLNSRRTDQPEAASGDSFCSFHTRIGNFIRLFQKQGKGFSLCCFHNYGKPLDELYSIVLNVLKREKRSDDLLGLDENRYLFLVLPVESDAAQTACERLIRKTEDIAPDRTVSFSIASYPEDGKTPDVLLGRVLPS